MQRQHGRVPAAELIAGDENWPYTIYKTALTKPWVVYKEKASRAWPAAWRWRRPAARHRNERLKLGNVVERGELQLQEVAYSRFEPLCGENGGRTMKFHGEVESGRSWNWRLGDLRFPAR